MYTYYTLTHARYTYGYHIYIFVHSHTHALAHNVAATRVIVGGGGLHANRPMNLARTQWPGTTTRRHLVTI